MGGREVRRVPGLDHLGILIIIDRIDRRLTSQLVLPYLSGRGSALQHRHGRRRSSLSCLFLATKLALTTSDHTHSSTRFDSRYLKASLR